MAGVSVLPSISKRLQGKVALITGGARGIGESTARLFARHGAKVVIADIQDELGHSTSNQIQTQTNQPVSYLHCDVTVDSHVENAVNTAVSMHGRLDIMFNNAGITGEQNQNISSTNYEDFKRVFDVNVYGAFLGAKHAARVMIPEKKGCILFTSSVASVTCGIGAPHPYTAAKHAVVGLAKNLCVELGQHGIRVNCISPYGVPTSMLAKGLGVGDRKILQELVSEKGNLKGVMLDEEDIAEAALYFSSDASKYVSGMNLLVDGGFNLSPSKLN